MTTRLSVNINEETAAALREAADRHDVTVTEVVRRAVSVYRFFRQQRAVGKYVQTTDQRGRVSRVVFL